MSVTLAEETRFARRGMTLRDRTRPRGRVDGACAYCHRSILAGTHRADGCTVPPGSPRLRVETKAGSTPARWLSSGEDERRFESAKWHGEPKSPRGPGDTGRFRQIAPAMWADPDERRPLTGKQLLGGAAVVLCLTLVILLAACWLASRWLAPEMGPL